MIKLAFVGPNRKVISFEIEGKKVLYFDEIWGAGIQIYPFPKELVRKLLKSKKPQISAYGLLIADANAGRNLAEYNKCKTEEDLKKIIRRDCLLKGLKEVE